MVRPGGEEEEFERPSLSRWLADRFRRPHKSKYWSDVCKDIGKYVLVGAVVAPFFGIGGASSSWVLSLLALAIEVGVLYTGSRLDPGEK